MAVCRKLGASASRAGCGDTPGIAVAKFTASRYSAGVLHFEQDTVEGGSIVVEIDGSKDLLGTGITEASKGF